MKTIIMFICGMAVGSCVTQVKAQTYITNTLGQPIGSMQTIGNTTYITNVMGAVVSQAQTVGNTTYITNTLNQPVAQVQKEQNAPRNSK